MKRDTFIILYDGVCPLCNRLIRFVLNHDPEGRFRFASLQSRFAGEVLARHHEASVDLNTLYLLTTSVDQGEQLLSRSRAVVGILKHIEGSRHFAGVLGVFPTVVLDFGYNLVAKSRYRLFGKLDACPVPEPKHRDRFIDI